MTTLRYQVIFQYHMCFEPGNYGLIRSDFPGGWAGDEKNGFTATDLTEMEFNKDNN